MHVIFSRPRVVAAAAVSAAFIALSFFVSLARPVSAFSGEDPLFGKPWHHTDITWQAAKAVGFHSNSAFNPLNASPGYKPRGGGNDDAAEALAWHADYIDSYLYNPLWWAQGGMARFKASLSIQPELTKLHFDDLFDSTKVHYMWRHYLSGTIAGLMWAMEKRDVHAAHNILGVSLHAIQDFYSHSNWVDPEPRRTVTYFRMPPAERSNLLLFTGAYEQAQQLGVQHHGKYAPICSILNQPGVSALMDVASSGFSPLSNTSLIAQYKECKAGTTVQPNLLILDGVRLPPNILFLAPAGIALDNEWVSEIGVKQRGLTGVTGKQMFDVAKNLALQASVQWLRKLEEEMTKAGPQAASFWQEIKSTGSNEERRTQEFESFTRMPYTFLSTGTYPPSSNVTGNEYYLRVRIRTGQDLGGGTNADIRLKADGKEFLLDYMPRSVPVLAYNDFETGDDTVYTVGPFSRLPQSIQLHNDAPDASQIMQALGRAFENLVTGIGDLALSLIAGHADHIGTQKVVWMPDELAAVPASGKTFTYDVNGADEGHYRIHATIRKKAESAANDPNPWHEFGISLDRLECVKESKWDRGSDSDEPFVLALACPLPGEMLKFRTEPFNDVDAGESNAIGHTFTVRVPKRYGMINLPIAVMESDDESRNARNELLDLFTGKARDDRSKMIHTFGAQVSKDQETSADERGFFTSLDSAIAADWKVENVEIYAWSRGGRIHHGTVFGHPLRHANTQYRGGVNSWLGGGKTMTLPLDHGSLKDSRIETDTLLTGYEKYGDSTAAPDLKPENTPVQGTLNPAQNALLDRFAGAWKNLTNGPEDTETITFTREGNILRGVAKVKGGQADLIIEARASEDGKRLIAEYWTPERVPPATGQPPPPAQQQQRGTFEAALSPDREGFAGAYRSPRMLKAQRPQADVSRWTAVRVKPPVGARPRPNGAPAVQEAVYTIGIEYPIGVTIRSLQYSVEPVNIGEETIAPHAEEKLLVVRFTAVNKTDVRRSFDHGTFNIFAVDRENVSHQAAPMLGVEGSRRSLETQVDAKTSLELYAVITMPAASVAKRLVIEPTETGEESRKADIDLSGSGKVTPLSAPFADPANASGTTALARVPAEPGRFYPMGFFDARLDSATVKDGLLTATFTVKNRSSQRRHLDQGVFVPAAIDTDGDEIAWDDGLYHATKSTALSTVNVEPGAEYRFRVHFTLGEGIRPKTLSLSERFNEDLSRAYIFHVPAVGASTR